MKECRRLSRSGHSNVISLPARMLNFLRWRGGDEMVIELTERNTLEIRPFTAADARNTRMTARPLAPSEASPR